MKLLLVLCGVMGISHAQMAQFKENSSLVNSAYTYQDAHRAHKLLYSPAGSQGKKHQQALKHAVTDFVHNTYHAMNCLDVLNLEQAGLAVQKCQSLLVVIHFLLTPTMMNKNTIVHNFSLELEAGIASLQNRLGEIIQVLSAHQGTDLLRVRDEALRNLEEADVFRSALFQGFTQWDTRLDELREKLHCFEEHLRSTEDTPSDSGAVNTARWLMGLVCASGSTLFKTVSASDHEIFAHDLGEIEAVLAPFGYSLDSKIQEVKHGGKFTNQYRKALQALQQLVEKINHELFQENIIIAMYTGDTQEEAILERVYALPRSSLFVPQTTTLSAIQDGITSLAVTGLEGSADITHMAFESFSTLQHMCEQAEEAVMPEGTLSSSLEGMIELAEKLKEEKEVIKAIAERFKKYHGESFIGVTDLMQRMMQLFEDIVKQDNVWGKRLQAINPELHKLFKSSQSKKFSDTLEAIRELFKTMGSRQPVSEIALICARHGTTIKLGCQVLRNIIQTTEPFFAQGKKNFSENAQWLGAYSADLYTKAYAVALQGLNAHAVAQAFHTLAQASVQADALYENPPKKLLSQEEMAAHEQYALQRGTDAMTDLVMQDLLKDHYRHLRIMWENRYAIVKLQTDHASGHARWQKLRLGWLYQRWYEKQMRDTHHFFEQHQSALQQILQNKNNHFSQKLSYEIDCMRVNKIEPLCVTRLRSFIYKALVERKKKVLARCELELDRSIDEIKSAGAVKIRRLNLTTAVRYLWFIMSYPWYYQQYQRDKEQLKILSFVKEKMREELQAESVTVPSITYLPPDEICKQYLHFLHPVFSVL